MRKKRKISSKSTVRLFGSKKNRYLIITFKTLVLIIVIATLGIAGMWTFMGDFFKIKSIVCEINKLPCDEKTKVIFNQTLGQNIFLFKGHHFSDEVLRNNQEFKQISFKKKLPETLLINLISREPFAVVEDNEGNKVVVDDAGVVLESNLVKSNLPTLWLYSLPFSNDELSVNQQLSTGLELIRLLKNSYLNFEQIKYSSEINISIFLFDQMIATLSAQKDLNSQVDSLQYILHHSRMKDKEIRTIDLRFQKPVVTFK